jgi:hypothetical protein
VIEEIKKKFAAMEIGILKEGEMTGEAIDECQHIDQQYGERVPDDLHHTSSTTAPSSTPPHLLPHAHAYAHPHTHTQTRTRTRTPAHAPAHHTTRTRGCG